MPPIGGSGGHAGRRSFGRTGAVALRSVEPDPEPYARFIAASGEPALGLGCGDGDPLLELRSRGVDVEGLDSSSDMLDRCRFRAAERGFEILLHHSPIETMDLPRRCRSIYLAGPTFNLLADDDTARRALERIGAHLAPGGATLIPLFIPEPIEADKLGQSRQHTRADGTVTRVMTMAVERDEVERRQTSLLRYELIRGTAPTVVQREWVLHWLP